MSTADVVIVGCAESTRIGTVPELTALGLHADAAARALADAGLTVGDIDGLATSTPAVQEAAHYLGVRARWLDGTMVGGCSAFLHVRHAVAAITAGLCEVALVTHGQSGRSQLGVTPRVLSDDGIVRQFEQIYGATTPYSTFTLPARAFLAARGLGPEDLAQVVVAQRLWAHENPRALRRELVTVQEVLDAPMVADPFTRDMCCPQTDGGGALVLMRRDRAGALGLLGRAISVAGAAESVETAIVSQLEDLTTFAAFERTGAEALAQARLSVSDVDHLMVYDAFAHLPLYGLECLGFVGRGESGGLIAAGATSPGGSLPMNSNGGGLCYTHTGMYGMFAITESVRQLRGEAAAQAPGVGVSMLAAVGQMFAVGACLVLSAD
jgi:acetyl-CoA acetyltransferase